jgi:CubicO group peptidase (beta-lactamase class C family)
MITNLKTKIVCLSVFLLIQPVLSQVLPTVSPEEVGMSSERLGRLDKVMTDYVEQGKLPGAAALIARRGKIAYFETFGMMDIETNKKMRTDTMFRIASMSKAITSVAVMILYEEGYFLLTDPVSKFIPEFKNPKVIQIDPNTKEEKLVPARREITIRHPQPHIRHNIRRRPAGQIL